MNHYKITHSGYVGVGKIVNRELVGRHTVVVVELGGHVGCVAAVVADGKVHGRMLTAHLPDQSRQQLTQVAPGGQTARQTLDLVHEKQETAANVSTESRFTLIVVIG